MDTKNINKVILKFTDSQFMAGSDDKRIVFYNTMKEITSIVVDSELDNFVCYKSGDTLVFKQNAYTGDFIIPKHLFADMFSESELLLLFEEFLNQDRKSVTFISDFNDINKPIDVNDDRLTIGRKIICHRVENVVYEIVEVTNFPFYKLPNVQVIDRNNNKITITDFSFVS